MPRAQASTNVMPLDFARGVINISTIATIGIGLTVTPTANGSISPIAAFTPSLSFREAHWDHPV
jgi:hypothetical protein